MSTFTWQVFDHGYQLLDELGRVVAQIIPKPEPVRGWWFGAQHWPTEAEAKAAVEDMAQRGALGSPA